MSDQTVFNFNHGISDIVDGYQCDYDGGNTCLCPYDRRFTQTFITFQDYKSHMESVHGCLPIQKRRVRKPVSSYVSKVRSQNTARQHRMGTFLNTHVKRETLLEFVKLYDEFVQDLLERVRYYDQRFCLDWDKYFRIDERDLINNSLEEIIIEIKNGFESRKRKRQKIWREREAELFDDLYN